MRGPSDLLAEDALVAMIGQVAEAVGAARGRGWFPLLLGGDCPVILGQQAGRAAHRDRNRQRQITGIGESRPAGQRRCQATLAQHGRAPGNPVHRATGIGRHADQDQAGSRHPIDATPAPVPPAVTAKHPDPPRAQNARIGTSMDEIPIPLGVAPDPARL